MNDNEKKLGRALSDVTIRLHESIAFAIGLSGTEHKALYLIAEQGPMTAGDLAKHTRLTTGAVTGLVDRLEARGYVKRVLDATDRRKVLIQANPAEVAALLKPLSHKVEQTVGKVLGGYQPAEQEVIGRYLSDIVVALRTLTDEIDKMPKK